MANRLQMNVTAKLMRRAQLARDLNELFHRVVRVPNDAGAQEQAFDVVALVEVEREVHDFIDAEACSRNVALNAIDAIVTVVDA